MSTTTTQHDSLHESQTKSDRIQMPTKEIRQRVEDRHWQLFEARLKKQLPEVNKENQVHSNDYRIINRLNKFDQPQPPIEPNRRWEEFCHQVKTKSNETNRVMSIFHNVWMKNWNIKQTDDAQKRRMTDSTLNENNFLNQLSTNDNDRKLISSILHRTTSSETCSSDKDKKKSII
ncbi:unnamed protein product [Adineta steineri]|uniref:Uncharacterized protein n=1 Tax=Adineta steineri TaxID=433720 RepID=A0A818IWF5_9BILA|nr:unnamed protein product [Adineta steineri]CAF1327543.1 unnamed protein product [Adineta steineri]CAF3526264.1 unnamed protein product [Adineta steineri]CAF3860465.1 unnamed protein product [Adineta steineri]